MASLEDLPTEVRDELAKLARDLSENPDTRKDFLRLTKKARPNLPVPEIEIDDRTSKALGEANDKVSKLEQKIMERDAVEALAQRRQKLIKDGKAQNDDEVSEIEKIMLDKKIADHDTAADYFRYMREAAKPAAPMYSPQVLNQGTRKELSPYWKNPTFAAREEAAKALDDIRKKGARLTAVR
jgi:hypothetical protein